MAIEDYMSCNWIIYNTCNGQNTFNFPNTTHSTLRQGQLDSLNRRRSVVF